ncbi:MAG: type I methionyl aminopeptidase [Anaeroplasma sp.]
MSNYEELVEKYQKLGIPTPDKKMIKTPEQIAGIREAGVINNKILDEVAKNIRIGMSTEDINTIVHSKTIELGGIPAPLNYEGFPKSVCTSVNDAVCHGIPNPKQILKDGDIINVDVTTIYNGYYADASRMFCIGKCSEAALKLVRVTKEALDLAVENLKPFSRLRDIGYFIERHAKTNGFSVVHEIGGHGVGVEFHEDPFIYHYGKKGTGIVLFPGMVFTIEPMINQGTRHVFLDASNDWTIYTDDGGLSAQFEYTVLITEDGVEILAS